MNQIDQLKSLARLDLNLIVVLRALDEHRHVTRAAEFLGLSQSAISHSLGRLREVFGDELYVKTSKGMVPTSRAERLAPLITPLIDALSDVFIKREAFSPSSLRRTFRIQTTDLIEHLLLPFVARAQAEEAPGLQVSFRNAGFSLPQNELEQGQTDLALAGFFGDLPDGFYKQRLFVDTFRCCVRQGHSKVAKRLDLATFCSLPHILIAPGGELTGQVDRLLKRKKLQRLVIAGTSGFLSAGWAVAQSDAVLTAPSRLIRGFEEYLPIRSFEVPFELPSITVVQVWHERQHRDPAHRWFRERIHAHFDNQR